jgi:hypothetical protein
MDTAALRWRLMLAHEVPLLADKLRHHALFEPVDRLRRRPSEYVEVHIILFLRLRTVSAFLKALLLIRRSLFVLFRTEEA